MVGTIPHTYGVYIFIYSHRQEVDIVIDSSLDRDFLYSGIILTVF